MKDTIKAKNGYKICNGHDICDNSKYKLLCDGDEILFGVKEIKTREWHEKEIEDNEMYHIVEVFTTIKGNQFIYSRDEETDEDFIVRVAR